MTIKEHEQKAAKTAKGHPGHPFDPFSLVSALPGTHEDADKRRARWVDPDKK